MQISDMECVDSLCVKCVAILQKWAKTAEMLVGRCKGSAPALSF